MKKYFLLFIVLFLNIPATQGAAALKGQSYEEAVTFSEREYQAYMDRIEKLNPEIHAKLKYYKDIFHEPAFLKAAELKSATVLIPTQKSHGQPMMVLPSGLSDEELERYLGSYKALTKRFIPGKDDFSDAEYQHYMKLINEIDPTMYHNLRKFEWETGRRNLSNAFDAEEDVAFPDNLISNLYYVTIKSILDKTEDKQREYLKDLFEKAAKNDAEYSDSDDNGDDDECYPIDDHVPLDEYEEYMKLIADIDHSVYKIFREYEKSPGSGYKKIITVSGDPGSALPVLNPIDRIKILHGTRILADAIIIPPHEFSNGNPIIIMSSMHGLSKEEKIKKLTNIIEKFNEAAFPLFPPHEYGYYMMLIEQLDRSVYENLIACERELGKPCIRPNKESGITPPSEETHGYPLILLHPNLKHSPAKEDYLKRIIQDYKQAYAVTEERTKVLAIIEDLAPELYTELVTVDPTGKNHIKRGNKTGIMPSSKNGLPLFTVSYSDAMGLPEDQLRFIIGHEISHYVQDDYEDFYTVSPTHKAMKGNETLPQEYAPGKKISSQLPFEQTFNKARSRAKEYEADAGSVTRFGTNIDAAIAWLENLIMRLEKSYEIAKQPLPTTFTDTHPLHKDRIAHLKSLQDEDKVKLQKASKQEPAPIDWKALIAKYKKTSKQTGQGAG